MRINFCKYQGTGNDFVIIDDRSGQYLALMDTETVSGICHRRFGVGADGLILLEESEHSDFRMIYFNADGRESTMCGNGGRCIVAFANRMGIPGPDYCFEAIDGLHHASLEGQGVRLEMTRPKGFRTLGMNEAWIDTGSPHFLSFIRDELDQLDVVKLGRKIRYSDEFRKIGGTNVNFIKILDKGRLAVRTYERGVEDETYSCGTGVTASAYVYMYENPSDLNSIDVETPGGMLNIEVNNIGNAGEKVYLSGPATFVFEGQIELG